jgi:DNA helicase-2/ATP-dependent DNA helicase PcrA
MSKQRQKVNDQVRARQELRSRFVELYKQLNLEQREAVDTIEGPVMVMAGPGTGKTQVLTMRIANILRQTDTDASSILCLTFTESAAAAMRERLLNIIGTDAYRVRIGTFHAFCNDIIQENPEKFALAREWQALSEAERIEVLRDEIDRLPATSPLKPFGSPYLFLPDIIENLQWLKKEGIETEELKQLVRSSRMLIKEIGPLVSDYCGQRSTDRTEQVTSGLIEELKRRQQVTAAGKAVWQQVQEVVSDFREAGKQAENKRELGKVRTQLKNKLKKLVDGITKQVPRQEQLVQLYQGYQKRLKEMGRYDFDDMIMQVLAALEKDDELLAQNQERWQYILVDEYQDTNGSQNEVVNLISSWHDAPNVFVVGDDKQSIFRFQGASLENLLSFWQRYQQQIKVIALKKNYRSHQLILDAAGQLISYNRETVARYVPGTRATLTAANGNQIEKIEEMKFETEEMEGYGVAKRIEGLIEEGVAPADIAVLGRYNRDIEEMGGMLTKMGIPVALQVGFNVLREVRVQQFKRLVEWAINLAHEERLADVLQYDWWGFKPLDVLKVIYFAGHNREGLLGVIMNEQKLKQAEVEQPEIFMEWAAKAAKWKRSVVNQPLIYVFDELLNDTGLLKRILHEPNGLNVLHALNALFGELKRMSEGRPDLTMEDFIDRLALMEENRLPLTAEAGLTGSKAVRLMTAHKAKGLEFEHVFIIKLVDRHWGNQQSRTKLSLPAGIVRFDPVTGQENDEDERRLFYVALTRAKKRLYWSYSQYNANGREQIPAQFRGEIGTELVEQKVWPADQTHIQERAHVAHRRTESKVNGEMIRGWAKEKLKNYVMSVTHLNYYLECPRMFYYRSFLHVPAAKNKHLAFGTAVHGALYDAWQMAKQTNQVTEKYLFDRFRKRLRREILSEKDSQDSLFMGEVALREYFRFYGIKSGQQIELEYSFRRHGVMVGELPLTGQLDKIEFLNNDQVKVVDYKTGNPDSAYKESRPGGKYHRQLVFYKLLCDESQRFKHQMVSGELDFIQPSKRRGKLVRVEYTISAKQVAELKETIEGVWADIKTLRFMEEEAGCGECEYCTAGWRRKLVE